MATAPPELDEALQLEPGDIRSALKARKERPMHFVLVLKSGADGLLLVARRRISTALLAEAKQAAGSKRVVRGTCFGEDGQLVFESEDRLSATLEKIVRKRVKLDTGITTRPLFRSIEG